MKIIRLKTTNGHISQKPQVGRPGSRDPRSRLTILEDQRLHRYLHLSSRCRSPLGSPDERPQTRHSVQCPSCPRPYAHHSQLWHKAAEGDLAFIAHPLACRSARLPTYFIVLHTRLSGRNTAVVFTTIDHLPGRNHLIISLPRSQDGTVLLTGPNPDNLAPRLVHHSDD